MVLTYLLLIYRTFNLFLINSRLTKYSIENGSGVNHVSKKDIVRGRHSFCLSYLAGWRKQLQWSNISAVLQISWYLMDEYRYQPIGSGRNMAVLIHAANSLPACKHAILCLIFSMTHVAANHCNLANTTSLLANSDLRKIL